MAVLFTLGLLVVYVGGIWKFWTGFKRTNFSPNLSNRLILSILWPVLIFQKSYRQNFTKALKGS